MSGNDEHPEILAWEREYAILEGKYEDAIKEINELHDTISSLIEDIVKYTDLLVEIKYMVRYY